MKSQILKQNSTHKAVKENNVINIYTNDLNIPKGYNYPNGEVENEGFFIKGEFLYSIPVENKDDLFATFERYDEDNRINVAEFNASL